MNIIFVNRYYWPDQSATAQILTDLAVEMANNGHSVHVITSRQLLENPDAALIGSEDRDGVQIHRVNTTTFGRSQLAGRAFDYLSFYLTSAFKGFFLVKKDSVVICKTDPPLIGLPFLIITKLKQAKIVNWWQDVYPEIAMHLGVVHEKSLVYRAAHRLRNWLYNKSTANIVIGQSMKSLFDGENLDTSRTRIIPNWSQDLFSGGPKSSNSIRLSLGLKDEIVIGYSGNLGRAHDLKPLIKLSEELAGNTNYIFLLIGGGFYHSNLQKEVAEKKLSNWRFLPYQDRSKLSDSISAINVHVVSLRPQLDGLIVPSKIYGALSAARPIIYIGSNNGEFADLVQLGTGHLLSDQSDRSIAECIRYLSDPEMLHAHGVEARRLYTSSYTFKVILVQWLALLKKLSN